MEEVADELRDRHRLPDVASALRACGRDCWVTECDGCGETFARVEVRASCDCRVCPWCARRRSKARVEAVGAAISRLPEAIRAQRYQAEADTEARRVEALAAVEHWREVEARAVARRSSRVSYWSRVASRARSAYERSGAEGARARLARALARIASAEREESATIRRAVRAAAVADHRVRVARRELQAIRESSSLREDGGIRRGRWRWRLVTISPQWRPRDPTEVDAAGLRRRVDEALQRWGRCWTEGARAGGLAAAYASVECSPGGHVHAHVLYLGPWVDVRWWARVAGCFVDVREVDQIPGGDGLQPAPAALMEAIKYALKSPSPSRFEWIRGDRRKVAHPRLAAAWVAATRRHQIARAYGSLREVLDCEGGVDDGDISTDAAEDLADRAKPACAFCGAALARYPVKYATSRAAELMGRGRWTLAERRHPTLGPLPATVVVPRA